MGGASCCQWTLTIDRLYLGLCCSTHALKRKCRTWPNDAVADIIRGCAVTVQALKLSWKERKVKCLGTSRALVTAFYEAGPSPLIEELDRTMTELEKMKMSSI